MKTADNRLHACKRSANMHCKHDVISKQTSSVKLSDFFSCWTGTVFSICLLNRTPAEDDDRQNKQTQEVHYIDNFMVFYVRSAVHINIVSKGRG